MQLSTDTRQLKSTRTATTGCQQGQPAPQRGQKSQQQSFFTQHPGSVASDVAFSGRKPAAAQDVRFGSVAGRMLQATGEKMLPFFQVITEVFLGGFLAQDVLAMWLPRVGTSLRVGRVPYDPSEDPQAKNLPFGEQVKKWIAGNLKGLNWINFNEETKREFATGPGVLMIPAVIYGVSRHLFGKTSSELGYHHLTEMSKGLMAHFADSPLKNATAISQHEYQQEVAKFFGNLFVDPKLNEATLPDAAKTYRQFLTEWADDWAKTIFSDADKKAKRAKLETLSKDLCEKLTAFNQKHRMTQASQRFVVDGVEYASDSLMHRASTAWVAFEKKHVQQETLASLTSNLRRFSDFVEEVWKQKVAQHGAQGTMAEGALNRIIKATRDKLVTRKFLLATGTLALASGYLVKLAYWAQNHDDYAATRLLKETPAVPGQSKAVHQTLNNRPATAHQNPAAGVHATATQPAVISAPAAATTNVFSQATGTAALSAPQQQPAFSQQQPTAFAAFRFAGSHHHPDRRGDRA